MERRPAQFGSLEDKLCQEGFYDVVLYSFFYIFMKIKPERMIPRITRSSSLLSEQLRQGRRCREFGIRDNYVRWTGPNTLANYKNKTSLPFTKLTGMMVRTIQRRKGEHLRMLSRTSFGHFTFPNIDWRKFRFRERTLTHSLRAILTFVLSSNRRSKNRPSRSSLCQFNWTNKGFSSIANFLSSENKRINQDCVYVVRK